MNVEFIVKCLLNRKVKEICIDVDQHRLHRLPIIYKKVRSYFPKEKVKVWYSSSRKGVHIIIKHECSLLEDLLWRAIFEDDASRYIFSWTRMALNPCCDNPDVHFLWKNGNTAIPAYDLQEVLEKYVEGKISVDEARKWIHDHMKDEIMFEIRVNRNICKDAIEKLGYNEVREKVKEVVEKFLKELNSKCKESQ